MKFSELPAQNSLSYVIGNSWQLNLLTDQDRYFLDREPFVLVCNEFPIHWRSIGFRPSAWAIGDTFNQSTCETLEKILSAISSDPELRERLKYLFVCEESDTATRIVQRFELPIIRYTRGEWTNREQALANSLDERIYHYGSTLTDVVNLALILNPGREVRLCGCQYGTRYGYFWPAAEISEDLLSNFLPGIERMWQGFGDIRRRGINLTDCNFEHSPDPPCEYQLPRTPLLSHPSVMT